MTIPLQNNRLSLTKIPLKKPENPQILRIDTYYRLNINAEEQSVRQSITTTKFSIHCRFADIPFIFRLLFNLFLNKYKINVTYIRILGLGIQYK